MRYTQYLPFENWPKTALGMGHCRLSLAKYLPAADSLRTVSLNVAGVLPSSNNLNVVNENVL